MFFFDAYKVFLMPHPLSWGCIGIMEKKMETILCNLQVGGLCSLNPKTLNPNAPGHFVYLRLAGRFDYIDSGRDLL